VQPKFEIHAIKARYLPDLWFRAVHDILDHGRRLVIDRGPYPFCAPVLHP
jgi:thymidylate synthase